MRKEKRWVYYCDFCKKSNRSGGSMKTHEKHCCGNPDRECRMCSNMERVQKSSAELVELIETKTFDEVKAAVEGCPPCMLAALLQWRKKYADDLEWSGETPNNDWGGWDFKAAMKTAYEEMNALLNEQRWEGVGM